METTAMFPIRKRLLDAFVEALQTEKQNQSRFPTQSIQN